MLTCNMYSLEVMESFIEEYFDDFSFSTPYCAWVERMKGESWVRTSTRSRLCGEIHDSLLDKRAEGLVKAKIEIPAARVAIRSTEKDIQRRR